MVKTLISEDEFLCRAANVKTEPVAWALAKARGVEVLVRRDDLIDDACSGNKFYKLFYNLQAAKSAGHEQLLSFGGAYSNHIYALAAAGAQYGFKTIGVIRGERPKVLSETLADAERWGMVLHFVSRSEYRLPDALQELLVNAHGDFFKIPEGGANPEGMRGAAALGWAINEGLIDKLDRPTQVCLACGTGNTLAGVASGLVGADVGAVGFSVLKGEGDLGRRILAQQPAGTREMANWRLISGYHGGGYARKLPSNIHQFGREFEAETGILLDPVYTLKMVWGVAQLLQQEYWPRGSGLLLVHTGGMQGRRGFEY